jgi:hypothetical protein
VGDEHFPLALVREHHRRAHLVAWKHRPVHLARHRTGRLYRRRLLARQARARVAIRARSVPAYARWLLVLWAALWLALVAGATWLIR